MDAIYIQDMGICNAIGTSKNAVREQLFGAQPNTSVVQRTLISKNKTPFYSVKIPKNLEVEDLLPKYNSRNNRLIQLALEQMDSAIKECKNTFSPDRISVVLGTSTSGIAEYEQRKISEEGSLNNYYYALQETGNCSEFVSETLGLQGLAYTVSTACSSSAKAMLEGARLIQTGLADAVIVGGSDSESSLTLNGFDSLGAISYEKTNPFSAHRQGINIGEGAALFLMSRNKSPIQFMGGGESSDAYHVSSPDPTAEGPKRALVEALNQAELKPDDISYLNLHGTGTVKNDEMESHLVAKLFGPTINVSSTKPLIGHSLGAAGAQELGFCYLALLDEQGRLPVHHWDGVQDENLPVLNFVTAETRTTGRFCMSNSFAFGGSNVSVILGRV